MYVRAACCVLRAAFVYSDCNALCHDSVHHAVIQLKKDIIVYLLSRGARRDALDYSSNAPIRYTEIEAIKQLFLGMDGVVLLQHAVVLYSY
jgi:hypothetical protein